MSLVVANRAAPDTLKRTRFWIYALTIGVTKANVHAAIDGLETAQAITAADAERLRIKIDDAEIYERLDPDLLALAQVMGVAADQAALDAHFRLA